jgi:hypothetical protein
VFHVTSKRVGLIEKMHSLRRQVSLSSVTIYSIHSLLKTVTPGDVIGVVAWAKGRRMCQFFNWRHKSDRFI